MPFRCTGRRPCRPDGGGVAAESNGRRTRRPKNIDEKTFARAIHEFTAIVGDRNVSISPAELVPYAHDVIMVPPIWP